MISFLRLCLTFGVAAGVLSMHPNSFMIFAAAGAVTLGLARYAGYDVTGVPALDLVFPIWTTICVYTVFSYHPSRPSLDQYLLAVDQKMGASWILGRLFSQYPPLEVICGLAYGTLPFIFVALYLFIPEPANRARLWWSTVISTAVCYIGYSLCPAAGPKYAFTALWPYSEPAMLHPRSDMVQGALNCMPSGHLIGALLFYWFSKTCHKYVRLACAVFLGLTLLATLGLGEHYWIDLIVAFPFALAIYRLCYIEVRVSKRITGRVMNLCEQAKQTVLSTARSITGGRRMGGGGVNRDSV